MIPTREEHIGWMQRRDAEYYDRAIKGHDPFYPLSTKVQLQREAVRASAETRSAVALLMEATKTAAVQRAPSRFVVWLRRIIVRAAPTCTLWVADDIHRHIWRFRFNSQWTITQREYWMVK